MKITKILQLSGWKFILVTVLLTVGVVVSTSERIEYDSGKWAYEGGIHRLFS